MGTVPQNTREADLPRKRMFGLLLILPGLLTAAPASLTKHVVKAPSPIYPAPVYNEYIGQGVNHGYGQGVNHGYGQGLAFGHDQGAAYGQGYSNGAHVTPIKPGHVFTGYPAYSQGHHTGHHAGHQVGHHAGHIGHQAGHHVGQYSGNHQHQHYPAGGHHYHQLQLPYPATQYLDSRYPSLGLKTANTSD